MLKIKKFNNWILDNSISLILGIIIALILVNTFGSKVYNSFLFYPIFEKYLNIFGHHITFHFLFNEIFMTFFFGIVTVELTQAVLPNGSLNPIKKAINPLFATLGGVLVPVLIYFITCKYFKVEPVVYKGWGIPTCTDISLAWLASRTIFGNKSPAVSYLLLLSVADDAVGLIILTIFYPNPNHPFIGVWLILVAVGMLIVFFLRRSKVKNYYWYILLGGIPSWSGLMLAGLHPSLALTFIVPFMPSGNAKHEHLFEIEKEKSTLADFEKGFKNFIEYGLLGFGLANANVELSSINDLTMIVFYSLTFGKTFGITLFGIIAIYLGFNLPSKILKKDLFIISMLGGLGLTVSLFIAGQAFTEQSFQMPAKMGALLSGIIFIPAFILGKFYSVKVR